MEELWREKKIQVGIKPHLSRTGRQEKAEENDVSLAVEVHVNILVSPTVDDTTGRFPSCTPAAVVLTMIWVVATTFAPSVTTLTVTDVLVAVALPIENRSI